MIAPMPKRTPRWYILFVDSENAGVSGPYPFGTAREIARTMAITPALVNIGDRWCNNPIGVAEEHLATELVVRHLDARRRA